MCSTWRRLGSSFQNAQYTSPKQPILAIALAWSKVGALESGFIVEPWPTTTSALPGLEMSMAHECPRKRRPQVQWSYSVASGRIEGIYDTKCEFDALSSVTRAQGLRRIVSD